MTSLLVCSFCHSLLVELLPPTFLTSTKSLLLLSATLTCCPQSVKHQANSPYSRESDVDRSGQSKGESSLSSRRAAPANTGEEPSTHGSMDMAPPTLLTLPQETLVEIIKLSILDEDVVCCKSKLGIRHPGCTSTEPVDVGFHNQNINLLLVSKKMSEITSDLVPQAATLRFAKPLCAKSFLSERFPHLRRRVSKMVFQEFGELDHSNRIMLTARSESEREPLELLHWLRRGAMARATWTRMAVRGKKFFNQMDTEVITGRVKFWAPKMVEKFSARGRAVRHLNKRRQIRLMPFPGAKQFRRHRH